MTFGALYSHCSFYLFGKRISICEKRVKLAVRHIPDKGQVLVRYFGLYANAHRGKVGKSEKVAHKLVSIEEECPRNPRRGWAEMIRKVYEVDPLICPRCKGKMRIISFITDYPVVDRILNHLKLIFVASKLPPPRFAYQGVLLAVEISAEYIS